MIISFRLNGKDVKVDSPCNERLSNVLRNRFALKSIKIASFDGLRGDDSILLDNALVPASLVPIFNVENTEVITLEHFSTDKGFSQEYKLIMKAFKNNGVSLCGFCDAGKIFATYKIIKSNIDAEDANFEAKVKQFYSVSLCRCTVLEALLRVAKEVSSVAIKLKRTSSYGRK